MQCVFTHACSISLTFCWLTLVHPVLAASFRHFRCAVCFTCQAFRKRFILHIVRTTCYAGCCFLTLFSFICFFYRPISLQKSRLLVSNCPVDHVTCIFGSGLLLQRIYAFFSHLLRPFTGWPTGHKNGNEWKGWLHCVEGLPHGKLCFSLLLCNKWCNLDKLYIQLGVLTPFYVLVWLVLCPGCVLFFFFNGVPR